MERHSSFLSEDSNQDEEYEEALRFVVGVEGLTRKWLLEVKRDLEKALTIRNEAHNADADASFAYDQIFTDVIPMTEYRWIALQARVAGKANKKPTWRRQITQFHLTKGA